MRRKEFTVFPEYKAAYLRAFVRMLDARKKREKETDWKTSADVFRWWIDREYNPYQTEMELELDYE